MAERELTQTMVEEWIMKQATGKFHYTKVLDGQIPPKLYPQLRTIMMRCKKKGIVFPIGGTDGWWRPADTDMQELLWWDSGDVADDNLILPMDLHNYCKIPKPSLVVIAGTYNAGKSAFCLNTVALNIPRWGGYLDFYVSEGGELIKPKFSKLGLVGPQAFHTYTKTENFADVLQPDNLSVIDYLRVNMEQAFAIGEKLFDIFNKVSQGKGIVVVAMQKPKGERKLAYGGPGTAFEPTLYLAMESTSSDSGWIGFEKIKVPRRYGGIDPYTLKIQYRIKDGATFYDVQEKIC